MTVGTLLTSPIDTILEVVTVKQATLTVVAAWTAWRLIRKWTTSDPLSIFPGPKSDSFLFGNVQKYFHAEAWDYHDYMIKTFPGVARLPSIMGSSMLIVQDPKALYHIIVKDQQIFEEPDDLITSNALLFGKGLISIVGEQHRKQRKLLNPVFSIAHMKQMVPIFYDVTYKLRNSLRLQVSRGETEIDMLSWMSRTALELIGQSGLGTSFDSLEPDAAPDAYHYAVKNLMQTHISLSLPRSIFLPYVKNIGTPGFRRFVVDLLPWKKLHALRDMVDVIHNTSVEIYERKRNALEAGDEALREQILQGKDIISILFKANMAASVEDRLTEEELLGQMSTFTFAAMDTTSNALSRILLLLSENPDVQERVRQEVLNAKQEHGELLYDQLSYLPYLDAVCRETLRLHTPVTVTMRIPSQDIVLPFSRPFTTTEGKEITEAVIPAGTKVLVGLSACNKDPLIWGPDSLEWKPERWLSPLPDSVVNARIPGVYSNLMTFGGGSRACIGFKFSQLEMKVVLAVLLESFKFTPTDKKIKWQWNGIAQPAVDKPGTGLPTLELPLNVSLIA
ncbi:cytochrome P450 [Coprinopsis marcescibilis]|uniref:Cytochrome P450 n=1 Tax=Coprinopsis marcescibilis TaxID=230819 RepID=A0A5C3L3D1_COPMA|nr:cytochrome P450 [Coprinopsis marcescibilis]